MGHSRPLFALSFQYSSSGFSLAFDLLDLSFDPIKIVFLTFLQEASARFQAVAQEQRRSRVISVVWEEVQSGKWQRPSTAASTSTPSPISDNFIQNFTRCRLIFELADK